MLGRSVAFLTFHEPDEHETTKGTQPAAVAASVEALTALAPASELEDPDGGENVNQSSAAPKVPATESNECDVSKQHDEGATSEKGVVLLDATEELTPDSVVPMTFSPQSTARQSGASSDAFPAVSPASSSMGGRSRYSDTRLQRFSGGDPRELRLEPLDIFSEDESEA